VKTAALFFPFDLFGSSGSAQGAEMLADAFREMLDDNKRERLPTRARAYAGKVRMQEVAFETMAAYQVWREESRKAIRGVFQKREFLLWVTGNHLGVLPIYDELAKAASDTLVLQFDAHLDIYNLSDCTAELSHGNFLLHAAGPLPTMVNIGSRELLLRPEYVSRYYQSVFPAQELAVNPGPALGKIRTACEAAQSVFLDIDCDVFDPAFFPAVTNPLPFGIDSHLLLRFLDAAWSEKVRGIALSEFDPARDRNDQGLATLLWLLEFVLLKHYEAAPFKNS
jgi:agmatinase